MSQVRETRIRLRGIGIRQQPDTALALELPALAGTGALRTVPQQPHVSRVSRSGEARSGPRSSPAHPRIRPGYGVGLGHGAAAARQRSLASRRTPGSAARDDAPRRGEAGATWPTRWLPESSLAGWPRAVGQSCPCQWILSGLVGCHRSVLVRIKVTVYDRRLHPQAREQNSD